MRIIIIYIKFLYERIWGELIMALAYGNFHELSHELRFLLFEIGIGLSQHSIEYFITQAHRQCLYRLKTASLTEALIPQPIYSHHLHDFLDQLQLQLEDKKSAAIFFNWHNLRHEMDECMANEAMAQAYRQCWQMELKKQASGFTNFWLWLSEQKAVYEQYQLFEQWGCLGHPYHPNFRAKIGFSRREVLYYSPEFDAQVNLHWGALHKRHVYISPASEHYEDLLAKQFPKEYLLWQQQLFFKQQNPKDYQPLPLHPWQWRNQIQHQFSQLIDEKDLFLFPHHQLVKPSMSFRSMMPLGAKGYHLKLPAAVQATSALRTVSASSIDNGPAISAWINILLKQQDYYENSLFIAAEHAGMRINSDTTDVEKCKQLGIILRQNPLDILKPGQRIVPLAALFAPSPLSNLPLLIDIIQASQASPFDFLRRYCRCVLTGQLHLLLRHGIAFEAHQQNTLIVFSENLPSAVIVRDFGNISVCMENFYAHPLKPKFYPGSTIATPELSKLCEKFIHGNFQSNFVYWVQYLAQYYSLMPMQLWPVVRRVVQEISQKIAPEIEENIFKTIHDYLLVKPWQHKALLSMRLRRETYRDFSVPITNPLSYCCHD
jgi:siderophore synthetase component